MSGRSPDFRVIATRFTFPDRNPVAYETLARRLQLRGQSRINWPDIYTPRQRTGFPFNPRFQGTDHRRRV